MPSGRTHISPCQLGEDQQDECQLDEDHLDELIIIPKKNTFFTSIMDTSTNHSDPKLRPFTSILCETIIDDKNELIFFFFFFIYYFVAPGCSVASFDMYCVPRVRNKHIIIIINSSRWSSSSWHSSCWSSPSWCGEIWLRPDGLRPVSTTPIRCTP